ncbi:MAG: 2-oxo acid dehydrogenase subunit E2, partial [Flavobacteriales bacterium]|nr:2-oxo acid dehydrogenase subunit E2 [Flavobacteriales bacterium]
MSRIEVKLPKMGESITEATILNWLKQVGEQVVKDEPILEVATDKVDSEIAAPESGTIKEFLVEQNDIVKVGTIIAIIEVGQDSNISKDEKIEAKKSKSKVDKKASPNSTTKRFDSQGRFYSPLIRSMAEKEGIKFEELSELEGSGQNGRLLKIDLLKYIDSGSKGDFVKVKNEVKFSPKSTSEGGHEIIEMDRMRSMIADHMVYSKKTSPHVTSYIEADVTKMVKWREKNKEAFSKKYGQKITYTPIFVESGLSSTRPLMPTLVLPKP